MNATRPETWEDKSFWLGLTPYDEGQPLEEDLAVDVAILGGGFTGVSAAHFLKKNAPSVRVALLESQVIGFGASGRNGGFSMTLFGLTLSVTKALFGARRTAQAHHYMESAVELVEQLVRDHAIDCDYERPGFLRVATTDAYVRRIREEVELAHRLGLGGIDWIDAAAVRAQVDSPLYLGAWSEPRCGLLNPAKLVRGMKRVIEREGVLVFERTPGLSIARRGDKYVIETPRATLTASRIALATNAYSHLIPQLKRKQVPVFTHIVLTEPLRAEHLEAIGWRNRQGIEDARNLVHYYRLTADNRLLMGGRDVSLTFGSDMRHDTDARVFAGLEEDVRRTFPALRDVQFTHRWGGPVSVPVQMIPAIGHLGGPDAVYSLGCMGHGVSLAHMNGWTLADLLLELKTERTEMFFVDRRVVPWPPEPLRLAAGLAIRELMRMDDRRCERSR